MKFSKVLPFLIALTLSPNAENFARVKYENTPESKTTQSIEKESDNIDRFGLEYQIKALDKITKEKANITSSGLITTDGKNVIDMSYISAGLKLLGLKCAVFLEPNLARLALAYNFNQDSLNLKDEVRKTPKAIFLEYNYDIFSSGVIIGQERSEFSGSSKRNIEEAKVVESSIGFENHFYKKINISFNPFFDIFFQENRDQLNREDEKTTFTQNSSAETNTQTKTDKISKLAYVNGHVKNLNLENILLSYHGFDLTENIICEDKIMEHFKKIEHVGLLLSYNIFDRSTISAFGTTNGHNLNLYCGAACQYKTKISKFGLNAFGFITNKKNLEQQIRYGVKIVLSKNNNILYDKFLDDIVNILSYEEPEPILEYNEKLKKLRSDLTEDNTSYLSIVSRVENLNDLTFMINLNSTQSQRNIGIASLIPYTKERFRFTNTSYVYYDYQKEEKCISNRISGYLNLKIKPFLSGTYARINKENRLSINTGVIF